MALIYGFVVGAFLISAAPDRTPIPFRTMADCQAAKVRLDTLTYSGKGYTVCVSTGAEED